MSLLAIPAIEGSIESEDGEEAEAADDDDAVDAVVLNAGIAAVLLVPGAFPSSKEAPEADA